MRCAAINAASDLKFQESLARMIVPATNAPDRSAVDRVDHVDPGQRLAYSGMRSTRHSGVIDKETRAGAQSIQELVRSIKSDLPLVPGVDRGGSVDLRDYRVLVRRLERRLLDEVFLANPKRRDGFLRGLAHALTIAADGGRLGDEWHPLGGAGNAFEGRPK